MDTAITIGQFIVLLSAAAWGYYKFWREGILRPRLEFAMDCDFFGPEDGQFVLQFTLRARNKGLVRYRFEQIVLSCRGIKKGDSLHSWEGMEPRLKFPLKLFKANVIPEGYNFFFVEPGVEQPITYITRVPENIAYIVAKAEFQYDRFTPHSIEGVFEVKPK